MLHATFKHAMESSWGSLRLLYRYSKISASKMSYSIKKVYWASFLTHRNHVSYRRNKRINPEMLLAFIALAIAPVYSCIYLEFSAWTPSKAESYGAYMVAFIDAGADMVAIYIRDHPLLRNVRFKGRELNSKNCSFTLNFNSKSLPIISPS